MAKYVDGFVFRFQRKIEAYRRMSRRPAKCGASMAHSIIANATVTIRTSSMASLVPASFKVKPGETVVFSWIIYKSRTHRDRVNKKVMKDPRLARMMDPQVDAVRREADEHGRVQGLVWL